MLARRQPGGRRGLTLIEIMVVVAIITLLISVLVPAVNAVRVQARKTASASTLGTLETGIAAFQADGLVGGGLPPSASDQKQNGELNYVAAYPYDPGNLQVPPIGFGPEVSGGALLVWALAGADLLGTPGFRTFRDQSRFWAQDTDNGDGGAYDIDNDTREPVQRRAGPFIDVSSTPVSKPRYDMDVDGSNGHSSGFPHFEIELETEAARALSRDIPWRAHPFFLDGFGAPILYWKADPAGFAIADYSPNDTSEYARGVYHFLDNGALVDEVQGKGGRQEPLLLSPNDRSDQPPHDLFWDTGWGEDYLKDVDEDHVGFPGFIRNQSVRAKVAPHKADSYILISPGPDLIYGSADDITNFERRE